MTEVAEQTLRSVEALLMAADRPLSVPQLVQLLEEGGEPDRAAVRTALRALEASYAGGAVALVEVAGGWRFQVREDYATLIGKLWEERPPRLSRALLETLALICYRQPISRGEIEDVRGVSLSSSIVKTLLEREWIKVVGYREVPGRPALFGTTTQFLDDFNVKSLQALPSLPEIRDLDALDEALKELTGAGTTDAPEDEQAQEQDKEVAAAADEPSPPANDDDGQPPADALH